MNSGAIVSAWLAPRARVVVVGVLAAAALVTNLGIADFQVEDDGRGREITFLVVRTETVWIRSWTPALLQRLCPFLHQWV